MLAAHQKSGAKQSGADAFKTVSKRSIQKLAQ